MLAAFAATVPLAAGSYAAVGIDVALHIQARTTRHAAYAISQVKRKRIEEIFGWLKMVGLLRKLRHRGPATVEWIFTFAVAAYNLVRIRNLNAAVT